MILSALLINIEHDFLLDTGSSSSYVSSDVVKLLGLQEDHRLGGTEVEYPDGSVVISTGIVKAELQLGELVVDVILEVIPGLKSTIILGNDTLLTHEVDILYSTLEVIIKGTRFPFDKVYKD